MSSISTDLLSALRAATLRADAVLSKEGASAIEYGEALEDVRAAASNFDEWMTKHSKNDFPLQWEGNSAESPF